MYVRGAVLRAHVSALSVLGGGVVAVPQHRQQLAVGDCGKARYEKTKRSERRKPNHTLSNRPEPSMHIRSIPTTTYRRRGRTRSPPPPHGPSSPSTLQMCVVCGLAAGGQDEGDREGMEESRFEGGRTLLVRGVGRVAARVADAVLGWLEGGLRPASSFDRSPHAYIYGDHHHHQQQPDSYRVEMTPGTRWKASSTPQKQPAAKVAVIYVYILLTTSISRPTD